MRAIDEIAHSPSRSAKPGPRPRSVDKRLRILLLAGSLHYGGAERQVVQLAKKLDRERFEPFLCSLDGTRTLFDDNPSATCLLLEKRHWRFDLSIFRRIARILRDNEIDVVHCFLFDAEIVGRIAGRWAGVPAIIASERNSDYPPMPLKNAIERLTRPLVDLVIANSHAGKRHKCRHQGFSEDKVVVVHNGVDTDRFYPRFCAGLRKKTGVPEDHFVVGMFASFKKQKNHEMFFRCAKNVLGRVPNTTFLNVCHTPWNDRHADSYASSLQRLLKELGIQERVLTLTDRDDVSNLYNICDLTVLTSRREGTPNVVLESMACGVPVVATDVADNALIIREGVGGHIVPLDDDAAMVDRICSLLEDDARRHKMANRAQEYVAQEFSLAHWAEKFARFYEETYIRKMKNA